MKASFLFLAVVCAASVLSVASAADPKPMKDTAPEKTQPAPEISRITFGGGCFWCMEAVFQRLDGVKKVVSGYAGGQLANPTYKEVCNGDTGHAEVVQIEFDETKLPLAKLLEVFFAAHDPTTLNRQGGDSGTQYRSVLFYENDAQKAAMEKAKAEAQKDFKSPIVTEITALPHFYAAEGYHQNYYNENSGKNPYCSAVIRPKLQKLLQHGLIKQ